MNQFPNALAETPAELPIEKLGPAGKQAADELASAGYEVRLGLSRKYAADIIEMAKEPAIREFCPNDIGSRFKDLTATEQWLAKHRAVFLLVKKDADGLRLAGYGWVGPAGSSHVPDGENTLAIRIGQIGQGQGLATPFTKLMADSSAVLYDAKNLWLETWQSNGGAVHVYHKAGFEDVAEAPAKRPTAAGGQVQDTRQFMSLSNDRLLT